MVNLRAQALIASAEEKLAGAKQELTGGVVTDRLIESIEDLIKAMKEIAREYVGVQLKVGP